MGEEVFLLPAEAGSLLKMKKTTLSNWRISGRGPPFIRVGVKILYERSVLLAWARERTRTSTTDDEAEAPPDHTKNSGVEVDETETG